MKPTLKPSARATKRRRVRRNPWAAKPGTEHAEILAYLKSIGAQPISPAERIRMKKAGLLGMPKE